MREDAPKQVESPQMPQTVVNFQWIRQNSNDCQTTSLKKSWKLRQLLLMERMIFLEIVTIEFACIYRKVYSLHIQSQHLMDIWFFRLDSFILCHLIIVFKFWLKSCLTYKQGYHTKKKSFTMSRSFLSFFILWKSKRMNFFSDTMRLCWWNRI